MNGVSVSNVVSSGTQLSRPYAALKPLIRDELKSGDEAAQSAGLPYYRRAGEMLHEARGGFPEDRAGERDFWSKAQRDFKRGKDQLRNYMSLADLPSHSARSEPYVSLRQALGDTEARRGGGSWHAPVQQVMGTIDFDRLRRERGEQEKEDQMVRQLAMKIVDIGYRALAAKMHPDVRGGSKEGMQRLNEAKQLLKEAL